MNTTVDVAHAELEAAERARRQQSWFIENGLVDHCFPDISRDLARRWSSTGSGAGLAINVEKVVQTLEAEGVVFTLTGGVDLRG